MALKAIGICTADYFCVWGVEEKEGAKLAFTYFLSLFVSLSFATTPNPILCNK
jgi:hypothetical protein